ncbi:MULTISPECIES: hypothetical protein [Nostoc]|uniref:Uncharacterized protein n=2 Tax=Nostoc TaxID=1177 RepID=A0ABR8IBR4_9NOSO|nr:MULTISPECIES: hypothetical protein [Nostoc]MBD2564030.1 hypothetical protein [Nostoc linckia FACHB-391]MBD2647995.1 hypothetical protein [Nostoc foliaceum FACHB-393]
MLKSSLFKPWVAWLGLATIPFWLIGQSELIATVIPTTPIWKLTSIGFIIWEIWLIVIGVFLLNISTKRIALTS